MEIFTNILLTVLVYAIITNLMIGLVFLESGNPVSKFIKWSCGMAWFLSWIMGFVWFAIKIWS